MKCRHLAWANTWSPSVMLHEWQVVFMRPYDVASMHVSKPCYISMYPSIDEPLWLNASLRHILVALVLIVNTLSISLYFSLIFLLFSSSHYLLHFKNLSLAMAMRHAIFGWLNQMTLMWLIESFKRTNGTCKAEWISTIELYIVLLGESFERPWCKITLSTSW